MTGNVQLTQANQLQASRGATAPIDFTPPQFGFFKTVGAAMDRVLDRVTEGDPKRYRQACKRVASHLDSMSSEYRSGRQPSIDYGDPLVRLAYLYRHVPVHANIIHAAIRETPGLAKFVEWRLRETGELRVCAFGGGPGTELLALVKHLAANPRSSDLPTIRFTVVDNEEAWWETWHALRDEVHREMGAAFGQSRRGWPFTIEADHRCVDMANCRRYVDVGSTYGHDLLVLNYVLSEIHDERGQSDLVDFLARMCGANNSPARVLIADRYEQDARTPTLAKRLVKDQSLALQGQSFIVFNRAMNADEACVDLGRCYSRLEGLGYSPRLRARAFFLSARNRAA